MGIFKDFIMLLCSLISNLSRGLTFVWIVLFRKGTGSTLTVTVVSICASDENGGRNKQISVNQLTAVCNSSLLSNYLYSYSVNLNTIKFGQQYIHVNYNSVKTMFLSNKQQFQKDKLKNSFMVVIMFHSICVNIFF